MDETDGKAVKMVEIIVLKYMLWRHADGADDFWN
jgi:hypothetical protein